MKEPKFDHSKAGWKRSNNFIPGLTGREPSTAHRVDKNGLTWEQRKEIEDRKDRLTYPEDKEVWE